MPVWRTASCNQSQCRQTSSELCPLWLLLVVRFSTLVLLPLLKQPFFWGWLESLETSWMNRVVSCLGVREQGFTRGNYFVSYCDVHHTPLSGFPWLLLHLRWVTSSPQTNDDPQAIGDCPLLSKQYFFSVSQNPSLYLTDTVLATVHVSSVSPRETFSSFLLSLLWHLSGLILLKICRTSWEMIPSYLVFPGFCSFLCKADFYPVVVPWLLQDSSIWWQRFHPFQKASFVWVHLNTLHMQLLQWAHKIFNWYLVCAVVIHTAHSTDCV